MLSTEQIDAYRRAGHLTVNGVFDENAIDCVLEDLDTWSRQFLASLPAEDEAWYLERESGAIEGQTLLRKLDNPAFHREAFARLAKQPLLVAMAEQLIGQGVTVFFSQVFMKPPEVGGPKPIHQDNFYFGPDDADATLTVWIALDDATIENGCLYYSNEHQTTVVSHFAPEGEPFNLQVDEEIATRLEMSPAPVSRGGVSFHHGNTFHQSSANRSTRPRRAVAFHYLRNDAHLTQPALPYDDSIAVKVT